MNYKIYSIIILAILISFFLISCERLHERCENRYYFSEEFKSHTTFNKGSYWIYEDSIYHKKDSVYLDYQEIYLHDNCDNNRKFEDRLIQHFHSSYFPSNNEYFLLDIGASQRIYTIIGSAYPMGHYWVDGEKFDSVLIKNVWYKDVTVCQTPSKTLFYWAKNIGLIKKALRYPYNNDTLIHFELVRYHIEE